MGSWQDAPIVEGNQSWQDAPIVPTTEPRTVSERVARGLGLTARYVTETPALTFAGMGDVLAKGMNLGLAGVDKAAEAFGGNVDYRLPENRAQTVYEGFSRMGFPEEEGTLERLGGAASRGVVASAVGPAIGQSLKGASSPVTQQVGRQMVQEPTLQAVSAGTGAISGQGAAEAGLGPGWQFVSTLLGSAAPGVAKFAAQAGARGAVRGGDAGRQRVQQNIDTFEAAGTSPSVGQATESVATRGVETTLSRAPGSHGVMMRAAANQSDEIAAGIQKRVTQLMGREGKPGPVEAGKAIETVKTTFVPKFRARQEQLYSVLDKYMPPKAGITRTLQTLDDIAGDIPGAENTSRLLNNPTLREIAEALQKDLADDGTMPYEAIKALRTKVGDKLSSFNLADDVDRASWKRLYGSLSDDMKDAADSPQALSAWNRANKYSKAGYDRIEAIEAVVKKNGGPEKVYNAALSGTKDGATRLRAVMQSLDKDQQKIVSASVLRRLGLATAGQQDDTGTAFSTQTFLTNWNKLSPEAKAVLFNRYGSTFRNDMNQVAKVMGNLREGSQVWANPSGTAQGVTNQAASGGILVSLLTGRLDIAATIGGAMASTNLSARLMTNPKFVRWLAVQTKTPGQIAPAQMAALVNMAKEDEDIAELVATYEAFSDAQ